MTPQNSVHKLSKPYYISGRVVHGFGRGSKKLGCPTANLQHDIVQKIELESGIYYGFAQLLDPPPTSSKLRSTTNMNSENNNHFHSNNNLSDENDNNNNINIGNHRNHSIAEHNEDLSIHLSTCKLNPIYPCVLSLGWNPHFDDLTHRTLEAHLLHEFDDDFYDSTIRIAICGYIRPEMKFNSLEELMDAIKSDIQITKDALKQPQSEWSSVINNEFFHVITSNNHKENNNNINIVHQSTIELEQN